MLVVRGRPTREAPTWKTKPTPAHKWERSLISLRRASRPGLLFATAPFLAGVHSAYEVAARKWEQQGFGWFDALADVILPRVGLGLTLAVAVYLMVHAVGSLLSRLDCIALAAQTATRFQSGSLTPPFGPLSP